MKSNKVVRASLIVVTLALLTRCSPPPTSSVAIPIHDDFFEGRAHVTKTSKGFKIALLDPAGVELDRTIFNYPFYQLDTADVDRDGRTDILLGLIKPTQFDPTEKNRLFILRIDDGRLRPLWLGSKVCQELVNFKSLSNGLVKTLEQTKQGKYAVGVYEWQGFGLTLIEYISNERSYYEAVATFEI